MSRLGEWKLVVLHRLEGNWFLWCFLVDRKTGRPWRLQYARQIKAIRYSHCQYSRSRPTLANIPCPQRGFGDQYTHSRPTIDNPKSEVHMVVLPRLSD